MDTGAAVTLEMCNVASNTKKQCVWSPGGAAALAVLAPRISLKGTPGALPVDYVPATPTKPAGGYAGGLLPGIKVLGAFIGEDEWCSEQLCKRVSKDRTRAAQGHRAARGRAQARSSKPRSKRNRVCCASAAT